MSTTSISKRVGLGLLALVGLAVAVSGAAAEADKKAEKSEESQEQIEQKLAAARRRLDEAAREVADLSMSMSEQAWPQMREFVRVGRRAVLGINLGAPRSGDSADGVEIVSVSPGGSAERAGLKAGDLLVAVNGKALKREGNESPREKLMAAMRAVKPGDKIELSYRRDGKAGDVSVVAQPLQDQMFTMALPAMRGRIATGTGPLHFAFRRAVGVFGSAELVPLTPKLGQYFGTDKGLLVVRAPSDSRFKLEDGDVIVDIDGRTPANTSHAFRILGSYQPGEKLKLNVLRQKKRMSFDITVPEDAGPHDEHMLESRGEPGAWIREHVGPGSRQGPDILFRAGPGMDELPAPPPPPPRVPIETDEPV